MRLVDYLHLIRQRLALVGAVIGVAALISVGLSLLQSPVFEARTKLGTLPPAPDAFGSSIANVLKSTSVGFTTPGTEIQLIQSNEVAERVAKRIGFQAPPTALLNMISVAGIPETAILIITARSADPVLAVELANGFAEEYLAVRRADANEALDRAAERLTKRLREIQRRLQEIDARRATVPPDSVAGADLAAQRDLAMADLVVVRSQLRDLSDREAIESGFGKVVMPAITPRLVRDTSPTRSLVFGILIGAPLAFAAVLLIESLSQNIRSEEDARSVTGVDVLGLIPADARLAANGNGRNGNARNGIRALIGRRRNGEEPPLIVDADPFSPTSEAYRTTSLNLAAAVEQAGARTLLFTSPVTGEGKTTTLASLAVCHAERGQPVALIDGDLRRPRAHELLGGEAQPGLAEVVRGEVAPRQVLQPLRPALVFVGSGEPVERPDRLLARSNVRDVLEKLAAATPTGGNGKRETRPASTLLVDSAPILQAAETVALARSVDAVVLVLRAGTTRRQAAARAVELVRRSGGHLLGAVLVGVNRGDELGLGGASRSSGRRMLTVIEGARA